MGIKKLIELIKQTIIIKLGKEKYDLLVRRHIIYKMVDYDY